MNAFDQYEVWFVYPGSCCFAVRISGVEASVLRNGLP